MSKALKVKEKKSAPSLLERWQEDVDRMEQLFEGFMPTRMPRLLDLASAPRLRTLSAPALDVYEEGDNVFVKAEIPGVQKDDLEVNVTDSMLTIRGEKERNEKVKEDDYYRCERSYGAFSRSVQLPSDVKVDRAEASFTDGVLEIRLPKTEEARKKAVKLKIK